MGSKVFKIDQEIRALKCTVQGQKIVLDTFETRMAQFDADLAELHRRRDLLVADVKRAPSIMLTAQTELLRLEKIRYAMLNPEPMLPTFEQLQRARGKRAQRIAKLLDVREERQRIEKELSGGIDASTSIPGT